ncbi:hypothetical protein L6R52_38770 [Myxococcota bacterium]|nr:hypothetical protein [Myxococcota bacterium]
MTSMKHTLEAWLRPHARAAALMDTRLDAARGEGALGADDAAFLDRHLERCAECQAAWAARERVVRAMASLEAKAPEGFAGRVLLAAKARGRAAPTVDETPAWSLVPRGQLVMGAALVALVAGTLGTVVALGPKPKAREGVVQEALTGGAGLERAADAADFVVRAPGLGAAKVRAQVTSIVAARGGTYEETSRAIIAVIPRASLVALTQDLASRGPFKMSKASDGELAADRTTLVLRFELD